MADLNVSIIMRLVNRITGPARRVTRDFEGIRQGATRASAAFDLAAKANLAGEGMARFARRARQAFVAPLRAATDFETAMLEVKAKTTDFQDILRSPAAAREAETQFEGLREKALQLGESTRFSAVQAAQGMNFLAMAGFENQEILAAMRPTLDLATASATELGRTADIMSNIMSGFGVEATQASEAADLLAKTVTSSNTDLVQLGDAMSYVSTTSATLLRSVAKQRGAVGVMQDMTAMVGLLSDAGIQGSRAGTTLNAVLLRLSAPRKFGQAAMKQLGVQAFDADKNLRPVPDLLADIAEKTRGMGSGELAQALRPIFGVEALPGLTRLLSTFESGELKTKITQLRETSGAAAAMAAVMDSGAGGGVARFNSQLEALQIALGEQILPVAVGVVQKVTKLLGAFKAWSARHPMLTKGLLLVTAAAAGLASVLAPMMFTVSALSTGWGALAGAFGIAKSAGAAVAGVLGSVTAAQAALVAGIGAATFFITDYVLDLTGLRKEIEGIGEAIFDFSHDSEIPRAAGPGIGAPLVGERVPPRASGTPKAEVGGTIKVEVDDRRVRVRRIEQRGGIDIAADVGASAVGT